MSSKKKIPSQDLRLLLQAGDPAAGEPELSREAAQDLRRRIMNSGEADPDHRLVPLLAAAASILLVALGLLLWNGSPAENSRQQLPNSVVSPVHQSPDLPANEERPSREIHFVTSGGTRVIWTLNPDFDA